MVTNIRDLPMEVVSMICECCTSVGDVKSLLQTCKQFRCDLLKSEVFGGLLRRDFDFDEGCDGLSHQAREIIYLRYKYTLERGLAGQARQNAPLLPHHPGVAVVRALILGAWSARRGAVRGNQPGFSKNLRLLEDFGNGPNLFAFCFAPPAQTQYPAKAPELVILKVALSHLRLRPGFGRQLGVFYSHWSTREAVYGAPVTMPMFDASTKRNNAHGVQYSSSTCLRLEPGILLHIVNFWVHHLQDQTSPMGNIYWSLAPGLQVSGWTERVKAASVSVKSHYLGFACSAEEGLVGMRDTITPQSTVPPPGSARPSPRMHTHGDDRKLRDPRDDPTLDDLYISSYDLPMNEDSETFWPTWLERATRVYSNSFSFDLGFLGEQLRLHRNLMIASAPEVSQDVRFREFTGYGRDGTCNFLVIGIITPMVNQYGLPGFQRFVMVKIYLSHSDSDDTGLPFPPDMDVHTALDDETLDKYAYEGVVLPGGRIIIGRWFFLDRHTEHGEGVALVRGERGYTDRIRLVAFNLAREHKHIKSGPFILWAPQASQNIFPEAG